MTVALAAVLVFVALAPAPRRLGTRGRASRRADPAHTGEAVARAARERSEQERESPGRGAKGFRLFADAPRGRASRRLAPGPIGSGLAALKERWRHRRDDSLPQALELTARALRSGASVLTALDTVATQMPETGWAEVAGRVRGGLDLTEALDGWAGDRSDRQTAAALLVLGHQSGAAMAASLDRAAASLRQRSALGDEIRALTSQTRVSGMVVAAAPAGFAAVIAVADPGALGTLVATPIGLLSLMAGLVLEGLGVWWMGRLSRGVVRWA